MALSYKAEDAKKAGAWPDGEYDGELINVEDKLSKEKPDGTGGNPMEVWTFKFYHPDGMTKTIQEYVPQNQYTALKVRALARAVGREDEFNAETFQAEGAIGAAVRAKLIVESQAGYDDKNRIGRFVAIPRPGAPAQKPVPTMGSLKQQVVTRPPVQQPFGNENVFKEDDIPF